jgi:hypothetical protein
MFVEYIQMSSVEYDDVADAKEEQQRWKDAKGNPPPSGYHPVKNVVGNHDLFPLDQDVYCGYGYNRLDSGIYYWSRKLKEKIMNGQVYVGFAGERVEGTSYCMNEDWQQKAKVIAERFLIKNNERSILRFKDGNAQNCRVQNLEWVDPCFSLSAGSGITGLKGITKYKKKMRNGTYENRYRVKNDKVEKHFKVLAEAEAYALEVKKQTLPESPEETELEKYLAQKLKEQEAAEAAEDAEKEYED